MRLLLTAYFKALFTKRLFLDNRPIRGVGLTDSPLLYPIESKAMITRENLTEVINQIQEKDKERILRSMKEYCVLSLHIFNSGSTTEIRLTNDYVRYQNVSNDGNCILPTDEVIEVLESLTDLGEQFHEIFND